MLKVRPRHWTMATKLIALSLFIGLGTLAIIGSLSLNRSSSALLSQQSRSLDALRTSRQKHIEQYFEIIREQIYNFAQNRMVTQATDEFATAFAKIPNEVQWDTDSGSDIHRAVAGYYDNEFKPRLEEAEQPWRGTAKYVPESTPGRILQSMYIANNPNPVGEKLRLDRAETACSYNDLHSVYHPRIRDFLESFGYYDIFLFDLEGNLTYSVFKETDYATNFLTGPYRTTNFSDVYRAARDALSAGEVFIEDFKHYEPSYGAPASFIGSPVFRDGTKVGVVVFQMPVDNINEIMGETAGLGETGETYLVGSDFLMRCNSRHSEDSTILSREVRTDAVKTAFETHNSGTVIQSTYSGTETLAAYSPVEIDGLDWGMVAEISMKEVTAPAVSLRNQIAIVGLIVSAVIACVAFFFSRTIVGPVHRLVAVFLSMAEGDLTQRLEVTSQDEIGRLSESFNSFRDKLSTMLQNINVGTVEITAGSTQVASSSQTMAEGACSQAASLEEISSSLEEISSMTRMNADNASTAASLSETAQSTADKGQAQMVQMLEAVVETKAASDEISKVIKVIDSISFQTNLLALNAAIESEGAGEFGKRFAIVAEEVRALAQRSADASQETSRMIEKSIQRATRAAEISEQVGGALDEIVSGTRQVNELVSSIASASQEQADGIGQINLGVTQLDTVTQENAASSDGLAVAAERTASQVSDLRTLMTQFKTGHQDVEVVPIDAGASTSSVRAASTAPAAQSYVNSQANTKAASAIPVCTPSAEDEFLPVDDDDMGF